MSVFAEAFPVWLREKRGLAVSTSLTATSYVESVVSRVAARFPTDTPFESIVADAQVGAVMNGYDGKYGAGHRAAWRHFSAFMAERGVKVFQIPKRPGGRPSKTKPVGERYPREVLNAVKLLATTFSKGRFTSIRRLTQLRWNAVEVRGGMVHVGYKPNLSFAYPAELAQHVFGPLARWTSGDDKLPSPDAPLIAAAPGSPEPMGEADIKRIMALEDPVPGVIHCEEAPAPDEPAPRGNGNGNGADLFDPVNET